MGGALLERVAGLSGFFISDLRDPQFHVLLLQTLRQIAWQDYSIEECCYCLSYIYQKPFSFSGYNEIKRYINSLT